MAEAVTSRPSVRASVSAQAVTLRPSVRRSVSARTELVAAVHRSNQQPPAEEEAAEEAAARRRQSAASGGRRASQVRTAYARQGPSMAERRTMRSTMRGTIRASDVGADLEVSMQLRVSLGAVLPGQESVFQQSQHRRKPAFDEWRKHHFHPGAHLPAAVQVDAQPAGAPASSLAEWLSASGFEGFATSGSVFGSRALPPGYEPASDEGGLPWLWHARTGVAVWPVRADLGCCGNDKEEAVTLYHYTSREGLHLLMKVLFQARGPLALYETLLAEGGLWGDRESLICTVLEPARYARGRDILRDRLGKDRWPPSEPEELGAASHCLPLALPLAALNRDAEEGRPDRIQVLDRQLRARLKEEMEALSPWARSPSVPGRLASALSRLCSCHGGPQQTKEEVLSRVRCARLRQELAKAVDARAQPLRLVGRGGELWRSGEHTPSSSSAESEEGQEEEEEGSGASAQSSESQASAASAEAFAS